VAQFDIHRNPSPRSGRSRPYLLVVQSDRFAALETRLVVALALRSALPRGRLELDWLTPGFEVEGQDVFLNPFEITDIAADRLGPAIASLAGDEEARRRIQRALDEVLSHF
jgi:toxin CcdB